MILDFDQVLEERPGNEGETHFGGGQVFDRTKGLRVWHSTKTLLRR